MSNLNVINLALSRARNISRRASIGWALLDNDNQLLEYSASMAGLDAGQLENAIRKHSEIAKELFLSAEPMPRAFNLKTLLQSIEESSIGTINLGKNFDETIGNSTWRDWVAQWTGEIKAAPFNPVIEKISLGIQTLHSHNRPWVTAVTASDLSGKARQLNELTDEFGFLCHINDLIQHSRALLVSSSQADIIDFLAEENFAHEPLEPFEIEDPAIFDAILRHCANEFRCSAMLLSDMPFVARLVAENKIDEIVHHLVNSSNSTAANENARPTTELNLDDWQLVSSSVTGNCNRMVYRKKEPGNTLFSSGNRFN